MLNQSLTIFHSNIHYVNRTIEIVCKLEIPKILNLNFILAIILGRYLFLKTFKQKKRKWLRILNGTVRGNFIMMKNGIFFT